MNKRMSNFEVMTDTKMQYESNPELIVAVKSSIERQYMVTQEENIDQPVANDSNTQYICSGKRSFEAAQAYRGKKTAVLNFANNRDIGGNPYYANAQEESLCRCSTLLPCLEAMTDPFYERHKRLLKSKEMGYMGNDDLIYTPDVVVFKMDERLELGRLVISGTDLYYQRMMEEDEWFKVDVITSAAPEYFRFTDFPREEYEAIITSRIKKILDVAAKEMVEALILGRWGCGVFGNDPEVVANAFYTLLKNYDFNIVEFALSTKDDVSNSVFTKRSQKYNR